MFSQRRLVAMTAGLVSQQQLKAFRKTVSSKWIRRRLIFRSQPFVDLTKKPAETRMGKGRGTNVAKRVSPVSRGTALVEIRVRRHRRRFFPAHKVILTRAARKLGVRTKVIHNDL